MKISNITFPEENSTNYLNVSNNGNVVAGHRLMAMNSSEISS